jgi:chemotaxis signal transduction protein
VRTDLATGSAFLPVRVGSSWQAIDLTAVVEILDWSEPMPLPMGPPSVLGVIAHLGYTVPVLALRHCLDLGEAQGAPSAFPRIVVVAVEGMRAGCLCDEVRMVGEDAPQGTPLDLADVLRRASVRRG